MPSPLKSPGHTVAAMPALRSTETAGGGGWWAGARGRRGRGGRGRGGGGGGGGGGAPPASVPALADVPPVVARNCIATPFDGETMASTCVDSPVNGVWRNITPAFVHALTFCTSRTCAVIVQSPTQSW